MSKTESRLLEFNLKTATCVQKRESATRVQNKKSATDVQNKKSAILSKIDNQISATGVQNKKSAILSKIDNQISATGVQNRKSDTRVQNLTKVKLPTRDHDLKLGFVSRKNSKNSDILKSYWLVWLPQDF